MNWTLILAKLQAWATFAKPYVMAFGATAMANKTFTGVTLVLGFVAGALLF